MNLYRLHAYVYMLVEFSILCEWVFGTLEIFMNECTLTDTLWSYFKILVDGKFDTLWNFYEGFKRIPFCWKFVLHFQIVSWTLTTFYCFKLPFLKVFMLSWNYFSCDKNFNKLEIWGLLKDLFWEFLGTRTAI